MISRLLKQLFGKSSQGDKDDSPKIYEVEADYACSKDPDIPFESLNPLQSSFKDKYNPKKHCVIEAGTGSGKTALQYIASRCFLDEGKIVIITAPTKELVKNLYQDALGIWGRHVVGLNTGHDKNVADKFYIVTTPEGYISAVRAKKPWTKAGLLIVDEAHNISEPSRGGVLDVAITTHVINGGTVLLMSGTFVIKREVAQWLRADLFISRYRRTKLHVHEIHSPDDLEVRQVSKKSHAGDTVPTLNGYVFNRTAVRLKDLKNVLEQHRDDSILIFVATKDVGKCLSEVLVCPFHNADIEEAEKNRLVFEFNSGTIKTLIATDTLAQGVNTAADTVIVFGTRRGGTFLDKAAVDQRFGRAGRGSDEAHVYFLGDKIEAFHAKKDGISKSMPLPVEILVLTVLSNKCSSAAELADMLGRTYAGKLAELTKVRDAVERYLRFLRTCNILDEKEGGAYSLTKEGALLSRYFIAPSAYNGFVRVARKLKDSEFTDEEKGCVLLSSIVPISYGENVPVRIEKDMLMKLISLDLDKDVSSYRAAVVQHYAHKISAIPPYFQYQLKDVERWIGMFMDMEHYGVHQEAPGKTWIQNIVSVLKINAAKAEAKHKKGQLQLV